jgi:hypothetical protein
VTDKGFVYVVPMKRKGEVLLAMKLFANEVGAPDAFVADMSGEQLSKEVKVYCIERRARIINLTAKSNFKLHGSNPHTLTLGEEGDILQPLSIWTVRWCYYREQTAAFPNQQEVLGRVLGSARAEGNEMCHGR